MRWTVEGADRITGEERFISVEAAGISQAEQIATARGLLVSEIYEEKSTDSISSPVAALQSMLSNEHRPTTVDYAHPARSFAIPDYFDIQRGAKIIRILGWICRINGLISLAVAAVVICLGMYGSAGGMTSSSLSSFFASLPFLFSAIFSLIVAALLSMVASLGLAIRDIARNSFASA